MKIDIKERKIVANIDGFIVPNSVCKFKDFMLKETREPRYKKLLELSGVECNLDDQPMIQMWYVGEELNSDNLVDHGFKIITDDKKYYFTMSLCYLPYCLLKGKREGDIITVSFPAKCTIFNSNKDIEDEDIDWVLEAQICLNQQGYRYARFGRFEDVLERLVG